MGQGQTGGRKGKMAGNSQNEGDFTDIDGDLTLPIHWDTFLHILSFVPGKDLIHKCRLVNSSFREAVDDCHLWITKMEREAVQYPPAVEVTEFGLDWKRIYMLRPFGRNLLKNWDGSGGLNKWHVISNGGDRFDIQDAKSPGGSQPTPEELGCKKCWATSYGDCRKRQVVDLIENGCDATWLDRKQPAIEVSEWVANRYDCASVYTLKVKLCDERGKQLPGEHCEFRHERRRAQWVDNGWDKVSHTFTNYGPRVRSVLFDHCGIDGQFWAGHFGPKMAAPSVKIVLTS